MSKSIKLTTYISTEKSKAPLKQKIEKFLSARKYLICLALNRRGVFLDKWMQINVLDGRSYKRGSLGRMQSFFSGVELIRKSEVAESKNLKRVKSWALLGKTPDDKTVTVHIREDQEDSNKLLYWISSYYK